MTEPNIDYEALIRQACNEEAEFLIEKNKSYGNSALEPVRIFSQADPLEQIRVRLDDKLSRFIRGKGFPGDNDRKDLKGYLTLWRVYELAEEIRNKQKE